MDERLKKRILMFYLAGVVNAFLGLYVAIEGRAFLPPETVRWLALFFFAFAAVDFWFPRVLKKKWLEAQAQLAAQSTAAPRRDEGGGVSRGFEEHAPSRRTPDAMQRDGPGSETRDEGEKLGRKTEAEQHK
jgi:hypothetical protein